MKYSVNNHLIVTPYIKKSLEKVVVNGMAKVAQASAHVGLTLLVDAKLNDGSILKKGSIIYFKEKRIMENQAVNAWTPLYNSAISEPFVVVPANEIEFVDAVE